MQELGRDELMKQVELLKSRERERELERERERELERERERELELERKNERERERERERELELEIEKLKKPKLNRSLFFTSEFGLQEIEESNFLAFTVYLSQLSAKYDINENESIIEIRFFAEESVKFLPSLATCRLHLISENSVALSQYNVDISSFPFNDRETAYSIDIKRRGNYNFLNACFTVLYYRH